MNIVAADPTARVLSEDEVLALLGEPIVMHLGMVDVCRKGLLKYTGTDKDSYANEMLKWARDGSMSVVELTPSQFRAFSY
jgi:hypothetical protein